jgi:hypothetical protein
MGQTPWGFDYTTVGLGQFGHKDYSKAKEFGATDLEIKNWFDKNTSALASKHQAGQSSGLYEMVSGRAKPAQEAIDWESKISDIQNTFSEQLKQYQTDFQTKYNTQQEEFQSKQNAFQMQQQQHNQMMLAKQNEVKTSAPVSVQQPASQMAIGPGRVASPQSAASLGRKPFKGTAPVVSGLNIR